VAVLSVASAVAATAGAGPAHAASCSAGYVGLTFDDGPSNAHTPALLNALKQNGLKATLFNEGQYAVAYPAQVKAEVAAGMWIGNHSYDHPHLTTLSQSQIDSGDQPDPDGYRQRGRRHAETVPAALR
jgi:peptidoglycan/xylan/chitin deacetylase (PgdA/CDA1 family)